MNMQIQRVRSDNVQSLGEGCIYAPFVGVLMAFFTLELPHLENKRFVSRIPAGLYACRKRWSFKYGRHFKILRVEDRSDILIHSGNYFFNSTGCILPGSEFRDINHDGKLDVINSKRTLKKMLQILPEEFDLHIIDEVK